MALAATSSEPVAPPILSVLALGVGVVTRDGAVALAPVSGRKGRGVSGAVRAELGAFPALAPEDLTGRGTAVDPPEAESLDTDAATVTRAVAAAVPVAPMAVIR